MIIHALHTNGYLYTYDTSNESDIDLWFEGRSIDDITTAFVMEEDNTASDYTSVGRKVKLEYVDGLMDGCVLSTKCDE